MNPPPDSAPAPEGAAARVAAATGSLVEPVVVVDAEGRTRALNAAGEALLARAGASNAESPADLAAVGAAVGERDAERVLVLSVQTLTEALRAPEENAESRRQLNQAQSVARIGSWTADMITREVRFSDEQYRLYGLEPGSREVDIGTYLALVHPEDRETMASAVAAAAERGEPFKLEHRLAEAGGVEWIEARCQPVVAAGQVVRMVGTCHDISERKRNEESLRASLAEVRASRQRIVTAADEERRRVERDLHDGAQQRLVSLTVGLRVVRARVGEGDPELAGMLDGLAEELHLAVAELRDLARGIHPAVLTEQGLATALDSLLLRSPLPARLLERPDRRLQPGVEIGVYYLVAEALTNAVKHAGASEVLVSVSAGERVLRVRVSDDGAGGARIGAGSGLRGLSDRVAALDGGLAVESPPGGGTIVTAEIPCE